MVHCSVRVHGIHALLKIQASFLLFFCYVSLNNNCQYDISSSPGTHVFVYRQERKCDIFQTEYLRKEKKTFVIFICHVSWRDKNVYM